MAKTLTQTDLTHFCGSEQFYTRRDFGRVQYTEGARHVAVAGEAWWLLEAIVFSARRVRRLRNERFQVWTLNVQESSAVLTCTNGDDDAALYTQLIPFTDFPLSEIRFWLVNGILMLPSEY